MATDNPLLGGGDDSFNDWASETTQKELKKILEGKLKNYDAKKIEELLKKIELNTRALKGKGASGTGGASGIDFTKVVKNINLSGGSSASGGAGPSIAKIVEDATNSPSRTGGAGGGGGPIINNDEIKNAKEEETEAVKKSTGGFWDLSKSVSASTIGLISFTAVAGALGAYIGNSIDGYRELINAGSNFNSSLLEMRKASADAGMGFDTFVKVLTKNSQVVKMVGTGEFLSLQKRIRRVGDDFGQFGLTVEGTSDFLSDYLETNIRLGNRQKIDETSRAIGFRSYMNELTSLSKATGIQREELAKNAKGVADNSNIRTAMNRMSKSEREEFSKTMETMGLKMAAFGDPMKELMADAVGSFMSTGNIGLSDLGKIAAVASGETANAMTSMVKRIQGGGDDANLALADLAKLMRGTDFLNAVGAMEVANNSAALAVSAAAGKWMHSSDTQASAILDATRMTREQTDAIARKEAIESAGSKALLNVQSNMGKAFGTMQFAILNGLTPAITGAGVIFSDMMDVIMGAFTKDRMDSIVSTLGDAFKTVQSWGDKFALWIGEGGIERSIKNIIGFTQSLGESMMFLADNIDVIIAGTATLAVIFAGLKIIGIALALGGAAIAGPVALVVGGVIALGGAIALVVAYSEELGGFISRFGENMWNSVRLGLTTWPIGSLLMDSINSMFDTNFDFGGYVESVLYKLTGGIFGKDAPKPGFSFGDDVGSVAVGVNDNKSPEDIKKDRVTIARERSFKEIKAIPDLNHNQLSRARRGTNLSTDDLKADMADDGVLTPQNRKIIEEKANSGEKYAKLLLEQMTRANDLAEQAQQAREEQIKQTKKRQPSFGMASSGT